MPGRRASSTARASGDGDQTGVAARDEAGVKTERSINLAVQSRNTLSASSTTPRTSSANTSKLSFQGFMTMTGLSTWRAKFHHPQDSHPQQSSNNLDFRVSSVASGVPSNDDTNEKPFNWKLFAVATITASSGLLFGYDLGIIGTLPSITGFEYFYISRSANRAPPPSPPSPSRGSEGRGSVVSAVCPSTEGNPMASVGNYLALSLFLSGMIGGFLGSVLCPAVGRRKTLICAAGIYTTGTVLEGLAVTSPMFFIGRAVMGIGVGITNQVAPIYLAEIAPARNRGAIGISFQFFITFGILLASGVGFLLTVVSEPEDGGPDVDSAAWRWTLLVGAIPGLLVMYGAICLTETPQFMMGSTTKGEDGKALAYLLLGELRQSEDVSREYARMALYCDRRYTCLESWKIMFLDRRRVPAIFVTTALAVFQQITFLNGVLFFLPDLLGVALGGPSRTNSVAASLTNSIINFFATAIAVYVADRFGRKPLFMEAGVQLSVAALVMAIALGIVQSNERRTLESTLPASQAFALIVVVEVFVSAYAWSWGPLPWAMPAELNAWPWRAAGTSYHVIVNFAASAIVGAIFSDLLCALNFILFVVVVIIVVIATAIVYLFFPDTLDVDLNETEFLFKGHWFWRHFYPEAERIEVLHRLGCPCCCGAQEEGPSQEHLAISGSIQDVPDVSFSLGDTHNPLPTLTDVYGVPCSVREGGFATSSRTTVPNISQSNIMSILGQSTSRNTHLPVSSTSSRTSHPSSIKE